VHDGQKPRPLRERDQQVGPTLVAAEAGEAARELTAVDELPQLALDEARHTVAVAARASFCEKRLEVLVHDAAQRAMPCSGRRGR